MMKTVKAAVILLTALILIAGIFPASAENAEKEFALLYSMTGYCINGTKRAYLRQLKADPSSAPEYWQLLRIGAEEETGSLRAECAELLDSAYLQWAESKSKAITAEGIFSGEPLTFQVTVYSCEFSDVKETGTYLLKAGLQDGTVFLSKPFPLSANAFSCELLPALSIHNANARTATGMNFGGFFDCNTKYGEAYSHGTYLNGLSNYYINSHQIMSPEDAESLHQAASVAFDYLMKIRVAKTGEIRYKAPERPGNVSLNGGIHNSVEGVCGLAAYMDAFSGIDEQRVTDENREKILQTVSYIDEQLENASSRSYGTEWKTSVMCHLYNAFGHTEDLEAARESALSTLDGLDWEGTPRNHSISLFEGLAMLTQLDDSFAGNALLTEKIGIWKNDIGKILEKSAYQFPTFTGSWDIMERLSLSAYNSDHNFYWVLNQHVLGQALDACYLWQLTGDDRFEKMAAGCLYYVTGLNFGMDRSMCTEATSEEEKITCASFASHSYGGVIPWDLWEFGMKDDGWASIVNGYTYADKDYVYVNADWQHGETFIRMDGSMLYAASLYEKLITMK